MSNKPVSLSANILFYSTPAGNTRVDVPAISKHLDNIYATQELQRKATLSKMETVQADEKLSTITRELHTKISHILKDNDALECT